MPSKQHFLLIAVSDTPNSAATSLVGLDQTKRSSSSLDIFGHSSIRGCKFLSSCSLPCSLALRAS
jgi:hypothetical protein